MAPRMTATLAEFDGQPEVWLDFGFNAKTRDGFYVREWIKDPRLGMRQAHWDKDLRCWVAHATGANPTARLMAAGFTIDLTSETAGTRFAGLDSLDTLVPPLVWLSDPGMEKVSIHPRLGGIERLMALVPGARREKRGGPFTAHLSDLVEDGVLIDDIDLTDNAAEAAALWAEDYRAERAAVRLRTESLSNASGTGLSDEQQRAFDDLLDRVGDVPDTFGLDLFPYQRLGALLAADGRRLISDEPGLGKGGTPDEIILTPTGRTTYGKVQVGDRVLGSDGSPTTVTGVYRRGVLPVWRITFTDGAQVVVDGDHLWQVRLNGATQIRSTADLATNRRGIGAEIPMCGPARFDPPTEPYPLDPYEVGIIVSWTPGDYPYGQPPVPTRRPNRFAEAIADLGLNTHRVHRSIPTRYRLGSPADRLQLLRGLLATDGQLRERGAVAFRTRSSMLRQQVRFIVESLGGTASDDTDDKHGLIIVMPDGRCPFNGANGLARAWEAADRIEPHRAIARIEPYGSDEVICIAVDAPDHLYLADRFVVTHNTRQGLATAAIRQWDRGLIVCPPVVLTNWLDELLASGLISSAEECQIIRTGRKERPLGDYRWAIVADSLLAARAATVDRIAAWAPSGVIYDEVHRSKNWESKRSRTMRELAERVRFAGGEVIGMTGTPLVASPTELASIMAITGQLIDVFGSHSHFCQTYARWNNRFGRWEPRKRSLGALGDILYNQVWVRRMKRDVLAELPRTFVTTQTLDVDLRAFHDAHAEIVEKVETYVEGYAARNEGREPPDDRIRAWAEGNLGLMSPLRKAAGLAKVAAATERITDWIASTVNPNTDSNIEYRPLLVWCHHTEVVDALAESIDAALGENRRGTWGIIDGATSLRQRDALRHGFQNGEVGLLLLNLQAASVGITLTEGSDSLFVESDWNPDQMEQAIGRQERIGQTADRLEATILLASGTLDHRINKVLAAKTAVMKTVAGTSAPEMFATGEDDQVGPSDIVADLVMDVIEQRRTAATKGRKKAT